VYRHLVRIAQAAIPDRAEWDAKIEPFDEILTLKPERTPDLDVTLTVALLPKGVRQVSNQERVRILGEIEAKLEQLGAFKQS
jgi:hypothetical protein